MKDWKIYLLIIVAWFNCAIAQPDLTACSIPEQLSHNKFQLYAFKTSIKKSEYNKSCMPCTAPEKDRGLIAFTKHWKIVLGLNQSYLGRTLLISCRHFGSYEDMTIDEAKDYDRILRVLLPAIKKTFDATHFNVSFLMNQAYRDRSSKPADPPLKNGQPNPHFHWHVVPRYNGERIFDGIKFEDPEYGDLMNHLRKQPVDERTKEAIIAAIRKNLSIKYINHR